MTEKPKIEYVRQIYIYGSEVKAPAPQKKQEPVLPKLKKHHVKKVYINPVALVGIGAAVVLLVMMAVSAWKLQAGWERYNAMEAALTEIKRENAALEHAYYTGFDPEEIRAAAEKAGMVPKEELGVMTIPVHVPEKSTAPSLWENLQWFLKGLFAEA